jgi:hypothetical protein
MNRTLGHAHAMGERTAAAEDDVAGRKRETLDGAWIERQQAPEASLADA